MSSMRRMLFFFFTAAIFHTASAQQQLIIHIYNPWSNDPAPELRDHLRMRGNEEVGGWYPGSDMTQEGGGWFYWVVKEYQVKGWYFKLVNWIGPQVYMGEVEYSHRFDLDPIMAQFPPATNEIWIAIPNINLPPQITAIPVKSKVINFFNPWPDNSPKIVIGTAPPLRMRPRDILWGWYQYFHVGDLERMKDVSFTDYFGVQKYTSAGLTAGPPLDLRSHFSLYDTIYIVPRPFPNGPPAVLPKFPGNIGAPPFRPLKGLFRDWALDNISFFNNSHGMGSTLGKGMVLPELAAPDYKPKKSATAAASHGQNLETWFNTITFPNGQKNDTTVDLIFQKSEDGQWEYDSDWIGGFFHLDNFVNPNNIQYADAKQKMRNFHFTMEMHMLFAYREGKHQKFYFRGDDDVWIYINNKLAIDLGGLHSKQEGDIDLDDAKNVLGLVNGQIYRMDIFYAERNPVEANFRLKTTMDLLNSIALYYKDKLLAPGVTEYDIWQKVIMDDGLNVISDEESLANVDFFISGPQFPNSALVPLPPGLHYGGITVANEYRITIDIPNITGLMAGTYRITFVSKDNKDRWGFFDFIVPPKPDHLDLDTTLTGLNPDHDAVLDSIVIPMDMDSVKINAVIRDLLGALLDFANGAEWTSRNPAIVTVEALPTDKSKAVIVKGTQSGTTWIVVTQPGLKPDSVKVIAVARPKWPIISSAVMLDDNGDVIPDLLRIALNDTFKAGQSLTSVEIDYKGQKYSIPAASCQIAGKTLSVPFTSLTGADGRPTGTCAILLSVDGQPQSHAKAFTDGVGPALVSADVLENDGTYPEVLFLTLSEPFFTPSISGPQLLLIKAGTTDTVTLTVTNVTVVNDSTVTVTLSTSSARPLPGDLLRLVPGSKGGGVTELNLIKPHDLNRPVVIGLKLGAAPIAFSYYQDTDADGILDRTVTRFKRKVASSEVNSIRVNWRQKDYFVTANTLETVDSATLAAPIRGTVTNPAEPATGGIMRIGFEFKAVPGIWRDAPVADSAAPVLVSAKLVPGSALPSGDFEPDRLTAGFSEAILQPGTLMPFLLSTHGFGQRYSFTCPQLSNSGNTCTFRIDAVQPASIIPSKGDTIWINELGEVRDAGRVLQANPKNRRVLLDIDYQDMEWKLSITDNPLVVLTSQNKSTTIKLHPTKHIQVGKFRSAFSIYSPTGSLVLDGPMAIGNACFSVSWDGRNKNGRMVGTSTYLVVVRVEGEGTAKKLRIRVGVKR